MAPVAMVKDKDSGSHDQQVVQLSISHDGDYATAVAIAAEEAAQQAKAGMTG